jgi:hypothetical protein
MTAGTTPHSSSPTRGEVPPLGRGNIVRRPLAGRLPLVVRTGEGVRKAMRLPLLAAVVLFLFAIPATAAEVITSFASSVTLQRDGSVEVTEIIEVNAEGDQIRRGIYRDIFTVLENEDGSLLRSSLEVRSVERDGNPEPFAIEGLGNTATRIRIGDADVFLSHGRHRYTIRYAMTRMGRRFEAHDEIYWNATGNYWDFPIERAVATVRLPEGAVIRDLAVFTGPVGSEAGDATATRSTDNTAVFRATEPLAPGEGMTVAVAFQKGILTEPEGLQLAAYWLSDHRDLVFPLVAVFLVLLYYYLAWSAVGRDPAKGTIIPLFHPPKRFSPALAHYVHRLGWEKNGWTAFTASLFDLGVKGLVAIDNPGKTLKVTVTGDDPGDLSPGQQVIFDFLKSRGTVTVDTKTGPKLESTRADFVRTIETENRQVYFRNNRGYVLVGILLSLLCLGTLVFLGVLDVVFLVIAVIGGVAIGLFTTLLSTVWRGNLIGKFILVVWVLVGGGNLIAGFFGSLSDVRIDTPLIAAASIVIVNVAFAILMRAPTVQGRKVMDQLEGFRMYLETAEKNRLNISGEPPMTVERFERILPYAIALGVEKPWSEHFEAELARNAVPEATTDYQPSWYRGRSWSSARGGFSSSVASVASGMSAAMIAAQPVSSSSSGFSGGGGW